MNQTVDSPERVQDVEALVANRGRVPVPDNEFSHFSFSTAYIGTAEVYSTVGQVSLRTKYGTTAVTWSLSIVSAGDRSAVVTGRMGAWPLLYSNADIFDDPWEALGYHRTMGDDNVLGLLADLVCGVARNVDDYYENGDDGQSPHFAAFGA